VISDKPLLGPEQWLEVGAMEIDNEEDYEVIILAAMEVGL
jgi:hypothetical protein